MLTLDHLVVTATDLVQGTAEIEAQLGVPLPTGGRHEVMGTHNRLLSLGPDDYLEVIAIDPEGRDPGRPRWFSLDTFTGPARLTRWAARSDDLDAALAAAPPGVGTPWDLARDAIRWRMAVNDTGMLPFDGLFPALLEWQTPHPAPRLPDQGVRLTALRLISPRADALRAALDPLITDARLSIIQGSIPRIEADFTTPSGPVTLG
jgi:hypothetical protein